MIFSTVGPDDATNPLAELLPRWLRNALIAATSVVGVAVIAPTLYLLIWALFGTDVPGRLAPRPTLEWYEKVLADTSWHHAIAYSASLSVVVAFLGASLAASCAYCTRFSPSWVSGLNFSAMTLAILNPLVPYGISLRHSASALDAPEWLVLGLGHLIIILPVQYFVIEAAQERTGREMLWAGRSLGATHIRNFFGVFLPVNLSAINAALAIGFFLSFDEIVCAAFVIVGGYVTVPLKLWQEAIHVVTPAPAVVATLIFAATALSVGFILRPRGVRAIVERTFLGVLAAYYREIVVSLIGASLTLLVLPDVQGPGGLIISLTISMLAGLTAATFFGVAKAWPCIRAILTHANADDLDKVPRKFTHASILHVVEKSRLLRSGNWIEVTRDESRLLADALFARTHGAYVGTDRNVPSRYIKLYPGYIGSQLRRKLAGHDVRILLFTYDELVKDYSTNSATVIEFIQRHDLNNVRLLLVDWNVAESLASRFDIPSPDLGLFDWRRIVFFQPPEEHSTGRVMMREVDRDLAPRLDGYFQGLIDVGEGVILVGLNIVRRSLSQEDRSAYKELVRRRAV